MASIQFEWIGVWNIGGVKSVKVNDEEEYGRHVGGIKFVCFERVRVSLSLKVTPLQIFN